MQYTKLYCREEGLRVEFVLQYRKLYCKSWLVWQWKGIVLQDYQVHCHRLVAKEVYCNITCRLKFYCNTPLCIVNKKDLGLRSVLQYNFCIVTNISIWVNCEQ